MRWNPFGWTLSALVLWAGCALPPAPRPADGKPANTPLPPATVTKRPANSDVETLLAYADQHSPSLDVARARAGRGDAEVAAADAFLYHDPELRIAAGRRDAAGGDGTDYEFAFEQRIEIAGEPQLRREAAARSLAARTAELAATHWSLRVAIREAHGDTLVARERAESAATRVVFNERLLEIARAHRANGR